MKIRRNAIITVGAIVALSLSGALSASAAGADVKSTWTAGDGNTMILRNGAYDASTQKGFGWAKVTQKHGIGAVTTVKFPTRNPAGGAAEGTDIKYTAWANKIVNGEVTDSVKVWTIMGFKNVDAWYGVPVNGIIGIRTTYCPGYAGNCPAWVDKAFISQTAVSSASAATQSAATGETEVGSYSPLGPVSATGPDSSDE